MQSKQIIHTVSCHAEGEVGDVIIGGVPVPPGETLISENLSSVHGSTAALNQKLRWGSWMPSYGLTDFLRYVPISTPIHLDTLRP